MTAWLAEMHAHTDNHAEQLRSAEACIARDAVVAASAGIARSACAAAALAHVPLYVRPLLLETSSAWRSHALLGILAARALLTLAGPARSTQPALVGIANPLLCASSLCELELAR